MSESLVYDGLIDRNAEGIPCQDCQGYADRVDCTPEELNDFNCHRIFQCCARAFVCRLCLKRIVGTA